MADVKISALAAATAFADANEYMTNESGTSKKVTGTEMREALGFTLVAGSSGAVNGNAAPTETWQVLTADSADIPDSTKVTVMTTTGLPAGTWFYDYYVIYQSGTANSGVRLAIDFTGTITRIRSTRMGQTANALASNGTEDQIIVSATGGVAEAWARREIIAGGAEMGPSAGVDTVDSSILNRVYGILVNSTSGDLQLRQGSESAAVSRVMADTCLFLRRLA